MKKGHDVKEEFGELRVRSQFWNHRISEHLIDGLGKYVQIGLALARLSSCIKLVTNRNLNHDPYHVCRDLLVFAQAKPNSQQGIPMHLRSNSEVSINIPSTLHQVEKLHSPSRTCHEMKHNETMTIHIYIYMVTSLFVQNDRPAYENCTLHSCTRYIRRSLLQDVPPDLTHWGRRVQAKSYRQEKRWDAKQRREIWPRGSTYWTHSETAPP